MRIPAGLEPFARTTILTGSGTRLFYYDAGSADLPGMVLVHGLGDEADTWRRVIPSLAQSHRVIAPDLPGFGRSPLPSRRRLTPRYLAGVIGELMESLEMTGVVLVGSSLGAALSQIVASAEPARISRLILVDGGIMAMRRLQAGLLLMLLPGLGERRYRGLADNLDAAYGSLAPYYASLEKLPAVEREFLRERVGERVASETQMRAYFSSFRGFVRWVLVKGKAFARAVAKMRVATLYVWGEEDHILPVEAGRAAHAAHPGAVLSVIPGSGHLPHQETPEEFLRVIDQTGTRSQ